MRKSTLSVRTYVLLVILVALAAFAGYRYQRYQRPHPRAPWAKAAAPALSTTHDIASRRALLFRRTGGERRGPLVPQDGAWQHTELVRATAALDGRHYAYIVLPMEQNYRYFDRVARLMSARWLAAALHAATGKAVMSPELALRLLGRRATVLDDRAVAHLARQTGAEVVHILVAYREPNWRWLKMHEGRLEFVLTTASGHILKSFDAPFHGASTRPFEMQVAGLAPRAVKALVGRAVPVPPHAAQAKLPVLPKTVGQLPTAAKTPLANALYLQWVGMLTPKYMLYERRRLFERSLLALHAVDHASPYYRLLRARALFYLYRRPTAMKVLAKAKTPAQRALREYLNGNYPQLVALVPKIGNPLLRAMAYLELRNLGYAYFKPNVANGIGLTLPSAPWSTLVRSAGRDDDIWYAPDNARFFASLDGLFPAFDRRFTTAADAEFVSGAFDSDGPHFGMFKSLFDAVFARGGPGCCDRYGAQLETADIWSLYRDLAVANLLRQLRRDDDVYGSYGAGKALAEQLAPWLQGNPAYLWNYADILRSYAKQVDGTQKAFVKKRATALAVAAVREGGGEMDFSTVMAEWVLGKLGHEPSVYAPVHAFVYPCSDARCDFPSSMVTDDDAGNTDALPYVVSDFGLLKTAAQYHMMSKQAVDAMLHARFDGAPQKVPFMADRLIAAGHKPQAMKLLRHALAQGGADWNVYARLGELLIDQGKFAAASKTFMRFPGFTKRHPEHPVLDCNRAYFAGRKLYWIGRYKEAMPLYDVAANSGTGAGHEYTALKYEAFVRGDYRGALLAAFRQAQRYNSPDGFRDYLTILQLAGMHQKAEDGFRALAPRFRTTKLWHSLLVGQRIEKLPFDRVVAWVKGYLAEHDEGDMSRQAVHYLTEQAATDRVVTPAQVKALAGFEKSAEAPARLSARGNRLLKRLGLPANGPSYRCKRPNGPCKPSPSWQTSRYKDAGFVAAYAQWRGGHDRQAVTAFEAYDRHHPLVTDGEAKAALPYFAMALAGAGHKAALKRLAGLFSSGGLGKGFYADLTSAVTAVSVGKRKAAIAMLKTACRHRTLMYWTPVDNWYEMTQVAEWAYHRSGDHRFLVLALDWSRRHQVILPQDSWAYAFTARYGRDRTTRVHAAAVAGYLDPRSAWLAKTPASIRRAARAWWPKHNPFVLTRKKQKKTSKVSL